MLLNDLVFKFVIILIDLILKLSTLFYRGLILDYKV